MGQRFASPLVVVHVRAHRHPEAGPMEAARIGFVVSKGVGNAVVRNRVKRRLRDLCRDHVQQLSPGSLVVIRATPRAAQASFGELEGALNRCLSRVQQHAGSDS